MKFTFYCIQQLSYGQLPRGEFNNRTMKGMRSFNTNVEVLI
jgi:hypothetical protein